MRRTRGLIAAGTVLLVGAGLTACSSGDEAPAPSASMPSSALALPSATASGPSPSAIPTGAAALACAAYFEIDLLNSTYAGGAVQDGDMTEAQVRSDFQAGLKELALQAKAAVADGSGGQKLVANSARMKKMVKQLAKGQPLSSLTKKQQIRFAKSSLRVQKACDRAGFPLPADNISARKAAGL